MTTAACQCNDQSGCSPSATWIDWPAKAWARLRYVCDVYALYALALIVPPLVLLFFR